MDNQHQYKYIQFRSDRNSYQVQIKVKIEGKLKIIARTAKTLDKAIEIRDNLMEMYKLDKLTLHCTRHTMATTLLKNNVPLSVVQHIGGWGNATTLLNTYVHSDNEQEFEAMKYLSV